jgi:hypothetical protein
MLLVIIVFFLVDLLEMKLKRDECLALAKEHPNLQKKTRTV